jgi:DNA-binding NarL/FixJ family response regulator
MINAQFRWRDAQVQSHFGLPVQLSCRQRQVLLMLCEGLPNTLVGRQLGISDNTVKSHVASVLRTLNAANTPDFRRCDPRPMSCAVAKMCASRFPSRGRTML